MPKFPPGTTGNPRGRPRKDGTPAKPADKSAFNAAVRSRIHKAFGKDADKLVELLQAIATDTKANKRERLGAINALLDRGWGKPTQSTELEIKTPEPMFLLKQMPSIAPFVPTITTANSDEPSSGSVTNMPSDNVTLTKMN